MCSSVPVEPQERELLKPRDWGSLSREASQELVEPPSLPGVGWEGGPIGSGQLEPGLHSPDKTVGESPGPEDLSHRPRRLTAPGVGHGVRSPTLPDVVGVGDDGERQ